jgi:hypothetical protein
MKNQKRRFKMKQGEAIEVNFRGREIRKTREFPTNPQTQGILNPNTKSKRHLRSAPGGSVERERDIQQA